VVVIMTVTDVIAVMVNICSYSFCKFFKAMLVVMIVNEYDGSSGSEDCHDFDGYLLCMKTTCVQKETWRPHPLFQSTPLLLFPRTRSGYFFSR
jgi:uncharacterized protein YodC (DUF2158 family)